MQNLNLILSHVVPIKSKVKISQNFVAFSEYMNFNRKNLAFKLWNISTFAVFVTLTLHFGRYFMENDFDLILIWGCSQTMLTNFPPYETLTKSGHFWTTYLPCLLKVVCDQPLSKHIISLQFHLNKRTVMMFLWFFS